MRVDNPTGFLELTHKAVQFLLMTAVVVVVVVVLVLVVAILASTCLENRDF